MILPHKLIVLIADGGRMLLLRNDGDAVAPRLTVIEHRDTPPPANRDLFSDAPGRSFSSHSPTRSAYNHRDAHAARERGFLAAAAASLAAYINNDTPGIIVAADPVSLGYLREHYPPGANDKLLAEFDTDIAAMPVDDIATYLQEVAIPVPN